MLNNYIEYGRAGGSAELKPHVKSIFILLSLITADLSVLVLIPWTPIPSVKAQFISELQLTSNTASDVQPSFSPDGNRIVFSSFRDGSWEVFLMNADGSAQTQLTSNAFPTRNEKPTFLSNGTQIVFISDRDGDREIFLMNSDGTGQTQLTFNAGFDDDPRVCGTNIVFRLRSDTVDDFEILIIRTDGSGQRALTSNTATDGLPNFSPDCSRVVFTSAVDGDFEIFLVNVEGTIPQPCPRPVPGTGCQLTSNTANDGQSAAQNPASFSPDGSRIIFDSAVDGDFEVFAMNADGTVPQPCAQPVSSTGCQLTSNTEFDGGPVYNPAGSKITYESTRNGFQVFVMNADGTDQTQLTFNIEFDGDPNFSPDGTKILFVSNRDGDSEIFLGVLSPPPPRLTAWAVRTPVVNGQVDCRFIFLGFDPINGFPKFQILCDEWMDGARYDFTMTFGGSSHAGTMFMKNDAHNLYAYVEIADDQEAGDFLRLFFDNDHDGTSETGDEILQLRGNGVYEDDHFVAPLSVTHDIDAAGTRDGFGVAKYYPATGKWIFELVHPLNTSDDTRDFSLGFNQTVGFSLVYLEAAGGGGVIGSFDYTVANFPVPPTASTRDLRITGFEVTQAVQCIDNFGSALPACATGAALIPLVRNKATVVRVSVDSGPGGAPDTSANLYLSGLKLNTGQPAREAVSLGTLKASVTSKATGGDRGQIGDTANFKLPASWLDTDVLILKAFVRGSADVHETNYNNNWAVLVGVVADPERDYVLTRTRNLHVYVIPINTGTAAAPVLPTEAQITAQQDYMEAVFPFADINYERGTWQTVGAWAAGVGDPLNVQLETVYAQIVLARVLACAFFGVCNPIPDIVYGILPLAGGIARVTWCCGPGMGVAANGGVSAGAGAGTTTDCPAPCPPLMAHEINHDLDKTNGDGETIVYSTDGDATYDSGEPVIDGITPPVGFALEDDAKIKYLDSNNNNFWNSPEAVVYSSDGDSTYDSGEPVISGTTPAVGSMVKDDPKVKLVDARNNNMYDQGSWGRHVAGPRTTDPGGTPAYGCGAAGPDSRWPWTNDNINEFGLDTRSLTVYQPTTSDVMSYCWGASGGGPPWTSAYRWQKIMNAFPAAGGAALLASMTAQATTQGDSLLVSGTILLAGEGKIASVLRQPGQVQTELGAGTHSIHLLDAQGTTLEARFFEPSFEDMDGGKLDEFQFFQILPLPPNTTRIQLRQGQVVLDDIVASANPPAVRVASPNGGETWTGLEVVSWQAADPDNNPLSFTIQYSTDGGMSWLPLASGVQGNSFAVDSKLIPGTEKALVRVSASDGFHTSTDASDSSFMIADKLPSANIVAPSGGSTFDQTETIALIGHGSDLEDGALPDNALGWESNISGPLGTGRTLNVQLSPGNHQVTLTVTDSRGNKQTDQVMIAVSIPDIGRDFALDWADYDNDGKITILDVAQAAIVFDKPDAYWDMNLNNIVDITDIALVAIHFDQAFPGRPYPSEGILPGRMDPGWKNVCNQLPRQFQLYCQDRI